MSSSTASQRKAWNEAMRSAAGISSAIQSRRSDRQKRQQRQQKARKGTYADGSMGSNLEEMEYRNAVRIDHLEECVHDDYEEPEQEDEYNEEDEIEPSRGKRAKRKKSVPKKKRSNVDVAAKRMKPRSLSSILVEEASRNSSRVKHYVEAEALPGNVVYPARKFCPVTGLFGVYKDPKSGVHYANLKALEQIQERLPPWLSHGGSATYSETMKSLRNSFLH